MAEGEEVDSILKMTATLLATKAKLKVTDTRNRRPTEAGTRIAVAEAEATLAVEETEARLEAVVVALTATRRTPNVVAVEAEEIETQAEAGEAAGRELAEEVETEQEEADIKAWMMSERTAPGMVAKGPEDIRITRLTMMMDLLEITAIMTGLSHLWEERALEGEMIRADYLMGINKSGRFWCV